MSSTASGILPDGREAWQLLGTAAPALGVGLLILGVLFPEEEMAALRVWSSSTAYSHCFFVLPMALYLAWERRGRLTRTALRPLPWAALAAVPLGLLWLAAERLGIMEGRQLVAMSCVQVLFLAVLGPRAYRAFAAPLLFIYFLVPFGAFLVPALQIFTTRFIVAGLNVLGIPNYADQFIIEIPEGRFYVAEACAGLRFLIASIVFGVLYGCVMYRSAARRVGFVALSTVAPVIANGFRGLGIVMLGHLLGSAQAAETDHVLYGWLFFSLVTLLLVVVGLPFREDCTPRDNAPSAPAASRPPSPPALLAAAILAGVLAGSGPALAALLERGGRLPVLAGPVLTAPPGCTGGAPVRAPGLLTQRFDCGGTILATTVRVFPVRGNPGAIFAAQRQASGESGTSDLDVARITIPGIAPRIWRQVEADEPVQTSATALWAGQGPLEAGLAGRVRRALASVTGNGAASVLVAVVARSAGQPRPDERQVLRVAIRSFLVHQEGLGARLSMLSAGTPWRGTPARLAPP